MLKKCKICGEEKDISCFSKVPKCVGGLNPRCRKCVRARQVSRMDQEMLANRPKAKARALAAQGLKNCTRCDTVKPFSEFHKCPTRWANGLLSHCKECAKPLNLAFRKKNKERLAAYNKEYLVRPETRSKRLSSRSIRAASSPRIIMQITLRHGLHRRPTDNPATIDDLMAKFEAQNGQCAVTGIVMTWAKGKILPTSLSLDRIDPNEGYSDANLRLICHAVNAFKGRMSDAEMLVMAKAIVSNMERNDPTWRSWIESNSDDDRAWVH